MTAYEIITKEKQTPKKPLKEYGGAYRCPTCQMKHFDPDWIGTTQCDCGQVLDWSNIIKYLTYIGQDSWRRYVYEDENKKIWKLLDCCSPRKICETRADTPYSSAGNDFDGEPDCPMKNDIIVKYC